MNTITEPRSSTARAWGAVLACLLVASFVTLPAAFAQGGGSGTVTGVITTDGVPQEGVRVSASSATDSRYWESLETDAEGRFTFRGAPLGTIYVDCYDHADELIAQGEVTLTEDGQTVTVELEPVS